MLRQIKLLLAQMPSYDVLKKYANILFQTFIIDLFDIKFFLVMKS